MPIFLQAFCVLPRPLFLPGWETLSEMSSQWPAQISSMTCLEAGELETKFPAGVIVFVFLCVFAL